MNLARFNMPLELGMAMSQRFSGKSKRDSHDWLVLVPKGHIYKRFLSDLAGYDPVEYDGTAATVVPAVMSWLATRPDAVRTPTPQDVIAALPGFAAARAELCAAWCDQVPWTDLLTEGMNIAGRAGLIPLVAQFLGSKLIQTNIPSIPPQLEFQVSGVQQAVPSGRYVQVLFVIRNAGQQTVKDFSIIILMPDALPLDSRAPWSKGLHKYAELETVTGRFLEEERARGMEYAWEDYRLVPDPDPPCYGTWFPMGVQLPTGADRPSSIAAMPVLRADFHDASLLCGDRKILRFFVQVDRVRETLRIYSVLLSGAHDPFWQDFDVQVGHFENNLY